MTRRPAVTLMEVLVAMFIMAIGMLALLALFPLGAVSMGQALKDDRCASSAAMAEQVAIATDLRHDRSIVGPGPILDPTFKLNQFLTQNTLGQPITLPATYTGPSYPVYVDPYGVLLGLPPLAQNIPLGAPGIPRTTPTFVGLSTLLADRWFSLPDDITFSANGTPDTTATGGVFLDRGRRYSWAYMLRRPQAWVDQTVELTVVVSSGRPTDIPNIEPVVPAAPAAPNGVLLLAPVAGLRRGVWILDSTPDPVPGIAVGVVHGDFYRVINITDLGGGQTMLEVQPNLRTTHAVPLSSVTIVTNVVEVFDKGTSWQP
jgi:hypothetical protein